MTHLLLFLLILFQTQSLLAAQPRTLICNFDGDNQTKVYKVVTAPGVGTTFRLPEGWKITDFVVTDPKSFHGESNGIIGIVTPLSPNKTTSVSILHGERPALRL
jgi:type IV secretory pathway VirB9-like protein